MQLLLMMYRWDYNLEFCYRGSVVYFVHALYHYDQLFVLKRYPQPVHV